MARKRANTPPYVPKKGLRTVINHLQNHEAGEVISREDLYKRGVSSHLIYPALAALRFLGLIDSQDKLTGYHKAFLRDQTDPAVQAKVVRSAYSEFFDKCPLPADDLDDLKERFKNIYELSDRVINSAFPLFQHLAQEAGIQLVTSDPVAEGKAPAPGASKAPDAGAAEGTPVMVEERPYARHSGYQIVLNLQVTKYTTDKDIIKMVRTARRAVHLLRKAGDIR
jgi:hypothetical protein